MRDARSKTGVTLLIGVVTTTVIVWGVFYVLFGDCVECSAEPTGSLALAFLLAAWSLTAVSLVLLLAVLVRKRRGGDRP